MVYVKIIGADQYLAMEFSSTVERKLAVTLGIDRNDIAFICPEAFFVHSGQEQTSFHVLVEILMPKDCQPKEKAVADLLMESLKDLSVHSHLIFTYFDKASEYDNIDADYPQYMNASNMVKAETAKEAEDEENQEEEEESEAPYMGNVFQELDDFVAAHPEMSKNQATLEFYRRKNANKSR